MQYGLPRIFQFLPIKIHFIAGLKLNMQKTKFMASGPITSRQIDAETMTTVTDFIFLSSKTLQMVSAAMKLKDTWSLEEKLLPT